ncbi:hypothetical protein Q8A67_024066 [Cirrhinus molitorella]|uniref:Uncharacterized protein n=1 Tax=Cirrhinus molitorella TaxID=172907 RepID=A0AA88TLJ6_9TELE|nr:hypothetical protein Q8A67_024066 [Cirrhinus molitorella]
MTSCNLPYRFRPITSNDRKDSNTFVNRLSGSLKIPFKSANRTLHRFSRPHAEYLRHFGLVFRARGFFTCLPPINSSHKRL